MNLNSFFAEGVGIEKAKQEQDSAWPHNGIGKAGSGMQEIGKRGRRES